MAQGVAAGLLVDPERKTVTPYQPGAPAKMLQGDEPVVIPALGGFSFTPDEIFA
ncbi:MAG: hypothetical protein M0R74_06725 [Dehalococcoidia bacterium]|nr:hypothetical protein [Dehalococcoidia bacterium]